MQKLKCMTGNITKFLSLQFLHWFTEEYHEVPGSTWRDKNWKSTNIVKDGGAPMVNDEAEMYKIRWRIYSNGFYSNFLPF